MDGIRIIELSRVLTGSYCTMLLGDMGAEIIKVDQPIKPGTPIWGGGWLPVGVNKKQEAAQNALQRNKKSIVIDLSNEKGKSIFYKLAKNCDVILECYRPGVTKRLKIDYATIKEINPALIYCSITGYGQYGPYSSMPGHDINYISTAGVLGLIGPDSNKPVIPLNLIGDFAAGSLQAALGITLAIIARQKLGIGQYIDISMTDGSISLISFILDRYFKDRVIPKRGETLLAGIAPMYNIYKTSDEKYISIGCLEPALWANLCKAINKEDFITKEWDTTQWVSMIKEFESIFITKTRDEWFDDLSKKDIAVSKVYDLDEAINDRHTVARDMIVNLNHDEFGVIRQPGISIKLSETPGCIRSYGPICGEHTAEILKELGYNIDELTKMKEEGVVA